MKNLTFTLGTLVIVCLLAAGCAKESRVQQFWGTSYNLAKYNQIANLSAPEDYKPITGMEGAVSTKVMENYIKSFEGQKQEAKYYSIDLEAGN